VGLRTQDVQMGAECDHGVVFDEERARAENLGAADTRRLYPRLFGPCPKGCGFNGIAYASYLHYLWGDW